ncbi:uncharacterized protein L203_105890 [Cryptococcus depauperatus CBS 7841]|uniref:Uncharacterized protein n=1 Tax=Cryptococcus depauperatus CBS 7841 TaxID=1295531 RepID=A0AAJ8JY79_9TREE
MRVTPKKMWFNDPSALNFLSSSFFSSTSFTYQFLFLFKVSGVSVGYRRLLDLILPHSRSFGTIFIGFGINAILRPENALSFFELDYPTTRTEKSIIDSLMIVYGARDVFMGLTLYITAAYNNSRSLGWTLLAASGVAYVDGMVCWANGHGEWNHWGYAPMITVVGALLLGICDRK